MTWDTQPSGLRGLTRQSASSDLMRPSCKALRTDWHTNQASDAPRTAAKIAGRSDGEKATSSAPVCVLNLVYR
jgi:hypothetical protein